MKNIIILSIILLGFSCSTRLGDFTLISTRNADIGSDYVIVERNVEGKSSVPIIIAFPIGTPDLESAIDDALKKVGGDLMTNAVMKYNYWYIPYIYGTQRYYVEGDVWKKVSSDQADLKLEESLNSPFSEIYTAVEKDGNVVLVEK